VRPNCLPPTSTLQLRPARFPSLPPDTASDPLTPSSSLPPRSYTAASQKGSHACSHCSTLSPKAPLLHPIALRHSATVTAEVDHADSNHHCRRAHTGLSRGRFRTDGRTDDWKMAARVSVTWTHCSVLFEVTWGKTRCIRADATMRPRRHERVRADAAQRPRGREKKN
jgi:hypothetical protein